MSRTAKQILSVLLFAALVLALLFLCDRIFLRKSLLGAWDMTNKIGGFYNEPEDEFEVMFFGSSHAYAAFSPLELWHETGIKSYVFATQQQPMWATYHYILEALKTQSPRLIVLEVQMMIQTEPYAEPSVVHSYLDDLPMSLNKLSLIRVSGEGADRLEYLLPLIRYHDRWSELSSYDFTLRRTLHDPYKGYVMLRNTGFIPTLPDPPAFSSPVQEKSLAYLTSILDLCAERGIDVWLVETPSNPDAEHAAIFLSLADILAEKGISFDDFNSIYASIPLDLATDFYDQHHLNAQGAIRFTDYFASILTERYPALSADPEDSEWAAAYAQYETDAAAAMAAGQ